MKLISRWQNPYLVFLLISAVWLPASLYSLTSYPAPSGDEAWFGSISAEYLKSGTFGVPIFAKTDFPSSFDVGRLYNIGLAQVFRLWGIGLVQARSFSVLGMLVSGWLAFFLGKRLYGPLVGVLSGALYLFSVRALAPSHWVRPDMWTNAAGVACFLLFWQVKEARRPWQALVFGALAAMAVDVYAIAIRFSMTVSVAMLVEFRQRRDWKVLGAYILGGLLGTVYWFLNRPAPQHAAGVPLTEYIYKVFFSNALASPQALGSMLLGLPSLMSLVITWGIVGNSRIGGLELGYIVMGLLTHLARRRSADKTVLVWWGVLWVSLFVGYKGLHHLIDIVPLISLSSAVGVAGISQWLAGRLLWSNTKAALLSIGVCLPLLGGSALGTWIIGRNSQVINYEQYSTQLRALIPPGSSILGEGTWWWALQDHTYTTDQNLGAIKDIRLDLNPAQIVDSVIQEREVNVILLDEFFSYNANPNNLDLQQALIDHVQLNCTTVGTVEGYGYGVEMGGPGIKRTRVYVCALP